MIGIRKDFGPVRGQEREHAARRNHCRRIQELPARPPGTPHEKIIPGHRTPSRQKAIT
jgi:hypothetical protein